MLVALFQRVMHYQRLYEGVPVLASSGFQSNILQLILLVF